MSGLKRHKLLKTNPIKKWVLALLAKNARDAFPSASVSWSIQPTAIDGTDFERKQSGHDGSKCFAALKSWKCNAHSHATTGGMVTPSFRRPMDVCQLGFQVVLPEIDVARCLVWLFCSVTSGLLGFDHPVMSVPLWVIFAWDLGRESP